MTTTLKNNLEDVETLFNIGVYSEDPNYIIEITNRLSFMIIGGNYYFEKDDILDKIIDTITSKTALAENNILAKNETLLLNILVKYKDFSKRRNDKLKNFFDITQDDNYTGIYDLIVPQIVTMLMPKSDLERYLPDKIGSAEEITAAYKWLLIHMVLAEADESLICDNFSIDRLKAFSEELDGIKHEKWSDEKPFSINNVTILARDKIQFLQRKIELRQYLCQKLDDNEPYPDILFRLSTGLEPTEVKEKNCFSEFYDDCKKYYLHRKVEYTITPIQKISGSNPVQYDIKSAKSILDWSRHLRKRLKDESLPHESAINEIEIVLNVLKTKYQTILKTDYFDSFSYRSAYNLLFNTYIKILLKQEEAKGFETCLKDLSNSKLNDVTFVRNIFNKIKDAQSDSKIEDYHPYKSLMKFFRELNGKIREDVFCLGIDKSGLEEKNEKEYIQNAENKITLVSSLYEKSIILFQRNLKWCKARKWNPIYLLKDESFYKYPFYGDIPVFVDSSFILPDHFSKLEENWYAEDQYRRVTLRSTKNRIQFEIHRIVTENSVDAKKEEFEKTVKANEFKMVQIVAMFVSIATFVLGNVKIFENRSLSGSLSVTFAFAACLLLFNVFFKWLVRDSILANIDVLRDSKKINPNFSTFRRFFTDFKYSVSDLILLMFILACGLLSGYYRHEADIQEKEDKQKIINELLPQIVREGGYKLDSLINIQKIDTNQKGKLSAIIEKQIRESVKKESLRPK